MPVLEFAVSCPSSPEVSVVGVVVVPGEVTEARVEAVKVAVPDATVPGRGPLDSAVLIDPAIVLGIPVGYEVMAVVVAPVVATANFSAKPRAINTQRLY